MTSNDFQDMPLSAAHSEGQNIAPHDHISMFEKHRQIQAWRQLERSAPEHLKIRVTDVGGKRSSGLEVR